MYPDMNNPLPYKIPPVWLLQHREYLEAYQDSLRELPGKLARIAGINSLASMMKTITLLEHLYEYLDEMEDTLLSYAPSRLEYSNYKINHISRIKELVSSTAAALDTAVRQVSWGIPFNTPINQAKRNLLQLNRLMEETVDWLGKAL